MRSSAVIRLLGLMIPLCAWSTLSCAEAIESNRKFDFYISPRGDDTWSGRSSEPNAARTDGPFATLENAKREVRKARSKESKAKIRVALRGGIYRLAKTIVFSMQDSAGDEGSTTYLAYPGETPIFSSGVSIKAWKKLDESPKATAAAATTHLWVANVPAELVNVLTLYERLKILPRPRRG